jgi:hypothetical protein
MILPDKHSKLSNSLIGVGATILKNMDGANTVSSLWNRVRSLPEISNFEKFTIVLDFLFAIGVIDFQDGLLKKANQ